MAKATLTELRNVLNIIVADTDVKDLIIESMVTSHVSGLITLDITGNKYFFSYNDDKSIGDVGSREAICNECNLDILRNYSKLVA